MSLTNKTTVAGSGDNFFADNVASTSQLSVTTLHIQRPYRLPAILGVRTAAEEHEGGIAWAGSIFAC